jgi:hypothetical protein
MCLRGKEIKEDKKKEIQRLWIRKLKLLDIKIYLHCIYLFLIHNYFPYRQRKI